MQEYIFLFLLFLLAVGFVIVMILVNRWIGVKPQINPVKLEPFECGSPPFHKPGERIFQVKYSTVAMAFLIFDIDVILLYPWALSARESGSRAVLGGAFFILILVLALVYIWRKGLLKWV